MLFKPTSPKTIFMFEQTFQEIQKESHNSKNHDVTFFEKCTEINSTHVFLVLKEFLGWLGITVS